MDPKIEELRRKSQEDPSLLKTYREACSKYTLKKIRDSYLNELSRIRSLPVRESLAIPNDGVMKSLDLIIEGDTYRDRINRIVRLELLIDEIENHLY